MEKPLDRLLRLPVARCGHRQHREVPPNVRPVRPVSATALMFVCAREREMVLLAHPQQLLMFQLVQTFSAVAFAMARLTFAVCGNHPYSPTSAGWSLV